MLEEIAPADLAMRLGIKSRAGTPCLASVADAARHCILAWRQPSRQRVTGYLLRQLVALGFNEDIARAQVRSTLSGLLDIGDITSVRLDGKASLVLTLPSIVTITDRDHVLLGAHREVSIDRVRSGGADNRIARHISVSAEGLPPAREVLDFDMWIGRPAYLDHLRRRSRSEATGTLADFWTYLTGTLDNEGSSIDCQHVRALVHPPGWNGGFFGHHNRPGSEGRWGTTIPDGMWCGVRAGRNANEWHPVLVEVRNLGARALDFYDWDEWTWALLARGVVIGARERMSRENDLLRFEYPIPDQFGRALRLLGETGLKPWSWALSTEGAACFRHYYERAI
jgi:hypothetical protein